MYFVSVFLHQFQFSSRTASLAALQRENLTSALACEIFARWILRSERPLCRQSLPQLFDLGNGFSDLRLRQVLAQLGRKFD